MAAFDKIKNSVLIEALNKIGTNGYFLKIIKYKSYVISLAWIYVYTDVMLCLNFKYDIDRDMEMEVETETKRKTS